MSTSPETDAERTARRKAACAQCPERSPIGNTRFFRCRAASCDCIWNLKLKFRGTQCPRGKW